ncbi:MAG: TolC family protein [Acidobacteria bacterium]|nr:TolC family protein [Acidobacteriota bacterium]
MNYSIMTKTIVIMLIMASSLLPLNAAQNPQIDGMSAEEAVGYALEHNKNLLADRKLLDEAAGRLKQAGLRPNPMLELMGGSSVNDRSMNELSAGVSVPLELGGRRSSRIQVAEKEFARMKLEISDRERRLAAEIRMKYAEAIEAARALELIKQLGDLNFQDLTLLKARVDEGVSPAVDLNMLRIEIGKLETQKINVESRRSLTIDELKNLLGFPEDEKLTLKDDLKPLLTAANRDELLQQALINRQDLQAARAAESVSQSMIEEAGTEGKLDMSLFTEIGRQSWRFDQLGSNIETGAPERIMMRNYVLKGGVTIMLPTRNRNQGNIQAAVAMGDQARLRREFLETMIRREISAALTKYETAGRIIKTYDEGLLAASRDTLRVMRASYELGHTRISEVLDAQRRLLELQMTYIEAVRDLYTAASELKTATGAIQH